MTTREALLADPMSGVRSLAAAPSVTPARKVASPEPVDAYRHGSAWEELRQYAACLGAQGFPGYRRDPAPFLEPVCFTLFAQYQTPGCKPVRRHLVTLTQELHMGNRYRPGLGWLRRTGGFASTLAEPLTGCELGAVAQALDLYTDYPHPVRVLVTPSGEWEPGMSWTADETREYLSLVRAHRAGAILLTEDDYPPEADHDGAAWTQLQRYLTSHDEAGFYEVARFTLLARTAGGRSGQHLVTFSREDGLLARRDGGWACNRPGLPVTTSDLDAFGHALASYAGYRFPVRVVVTVRDASVYLSADEARDYLAMARAHRADSSGRSA